MARDLGQRSVYAYSGWEIDLTRREVRLRGAHVPLGGRAFDIIAVLVGSAGQLVTKEELLEQIWSGVFVEEIALRVHIAAIRKAFGADRGMLESRKKRGSQRAHDGIIAADTGLISKLADTPRLCAVSDDVERSAGKVETNAVARLVMLNCGLRLRS
jgi:DNA-binding winged helix-turn-helix (wHTH) protein